MEKKDIQGEKMKVLITGINGFVGSHLAEYILNNKLGEVAGTIRGKTVNLNNVQGIRSKIQLVECNITDSYAVKKTIDEIDPDYVFHLAAQAFVPSSWRSPVETMTTNIIGSLNLFEALRGSKSNPVIQIAGSSEEYGLVKPEEIPIKESNPLRPLSPYGVSKVGMDMLGFQYFHSYGMKIVRTRAFNHSGPRRGEMYVDSDWSKQVAEIENEKKQPAIYVGNLNAKRDFTDVRDIVKAYYLAVTKGKVGEAYNICSGKTYSMKEVLDKILALSRSKKKIEIKQDPKRLRPSDVELLLGDSTKFREATGWKPEIPYDKTLEDMLNYWRERV